MTNTKTAGRFITEFRGALLEEGDYVLFKGIWHRLNKRLATDQPSAWAQRFEAETRSGEVTELWLNHQATFHVYVEREV